MTPEPRPAVRPLTPRSFSACGLLAALLFAGAAARAVTTTNIALTITSAWRYQTNNLDAMPAWKSPAYDDSAWAGPGNALLYIETAPLVAPKNTPLPERPGGGPMLTYYFRTTFTVTNAAQVTSLVFSNLIDDGAVFYLNGVELQRVRMDAGPVFYTNLANALPPSGDITNYESFLISGALLNTLVDGTNTLAAEVHQQAPTSSDIVFGSAVAVVSDDGVIPSVVTLTSPTNGSTYISPATIPLAATATGTNHSATNLQFFNGATLLGEDRSPPFNYTWSGVANGGYTLTAVGRYDDGVTVTSAPVAINVIAPTSPQLTRGPYLQLGTPTSIVIRWRTSVAADSRVIYGTNPAALNLTNLDSQAVTEHELQLRGLSPDTLYDYAVGTSTGLLAGPGGAWSFVTHPPPGSPKPIRVWVIGDAGTGTASQIAVRNQFETWNGTNRVHVWLQLGDNAYNSGLDSEFQAKLFNIYTNELRSTVTWPTLGNHETAQSTAFVDTYAHFLNFTLPTAGEAGGVPSGTEHYYSFDCGLTHFVCLDSMTADRSTNGAMATWLRADLAANTNRWLIAFWHHPPYSKGSHDSDTEGPLIEMRQNFLPLLEGAGVDLVLAGHSHSYERSFLLDGHYGSSLTFTTNFIVQPGGGRENSGTGAYLKPENAAGPPIAHYGAVYAVAGSSGQTGGGALNHPAMFISLNRLGSMVLDITSNRLDAKFLRETNSIDDWFTIIKTNYPPVASNSVFTLAADTATTLTLTGGDVNRNPFTFATVTLPTNGLISNFDPVTGAFTYTPARGQRSGDALSFTASDGQLVSPPALAAIVITPPADANSNGLADSWESYYGVSDPDGDPDGDGVGNLQEYWAGTNPTNALSWLRITRITNGGGGQVLVWSSVGGTRYRVHFSNGDSNGGFNGVFTPVVRPVAEEMDPNPVGTPGTMSFTDDTTLTGGPSPTGNRFYRIQVVR
jgi:hypothetical protein